MRTFTTRPATRERVPLLIGLFGPSSSGKTYSSLRLATGIQRVTGGEIFVIDTEARRSLHYASDFAFRHLAFGAPFSPLDYLAAIEHCAKEGASVLVVDSASHEHEGPGGVIDWHDQEVQRLAKGDDKKAERVKMLAWSKPKQARQRLINGILQLPINVIFCFRAKEKLEIKPGREPRQLGWMPIGADAWLYEMTVSALLEPGAAGKPSWHSDELGSRAVIKLPGWARELVAHDKALDEETGERLARWAEGTVVRGAAELLEAYASAQDSATLGGLERERAALWRTASADEKKALKAASEEAAARVKSAEEPAQAEPDVDAGELSAEDQDRMAKALEDEHTRLRAAKEG